MIAIKFDVQGIKDLLEVTSGAKIEKAIRFAINRTAQHGKTVVSEEVRKLWNVRKADLDKKITVRGLVRDSATITITGKPISLMYFEPRIIDKGVIYTTRKRLALVGRKYKGRKVKEISVKVMHSRGRIVLSPRSFMIFAKGVPLIMRRHQSTKKLVKRSVVPITYMTTVRFSEIRTRIESMLSRQWLNQYKQILAGRAGYLE